MNHRIQSISDGEHGTVLLIYTCGHPTRSPNEDTARKRHAIHADAVATAIKAAKAIEGGPSGPSFVELMGDGPAK